MLDLLTLRLFALAAEHKSLTKVSQAANIAIAAISRRISNLEVELGVRLFKRSRRGVELTPSGEACLMRTRNILDELNRLQGDMGDFRNGMRGRVSIRASTSAVAQFLPGDLAAFAEANPAIGLEIQEAYSANIVSEVREGNCDIGVVLEGGETFGLRIWPYRCDQLVVVAPQSFRPGVNRLKFADLFKENLVQMGFDTAMTRLLAAKASEAGEALRLRVAVDSFDAVCRMISAGFGVGILPQMAAASHVQNSELRLIELDEPWSVRQMLICAKPDVEPSSPIELLISFLRSRANQ